MLYTCQIYYIYINIYVCFDTLLCDFDSFLGRLYILFDFFYDLLIKEHIIQSPYVCIFSRISYIISFLLHSIWLEKICDMLSIFKLVGFVLWMVHLRECDKQNVCVSESKLKCSIQLNQIHLVASIVHCYFFSQFYIKY